VIVIGFNCTAIDIDATHARSQMNVYLVFLVECLVMNQNVGLVRAIEEKALGKWRPVVRGSGLRAVAAVPSFVPDRRWVLIEEIV
jgi:hypothetical protein